MQDVRKVVEALRQIMAAKGIALQGLCQRDGRRRDKSSGEKRKWGGHRVKGAGHAAATDWEHTDANGAEELALAASLKRHRKE